MPFCGLTSRKDAGLWLRNCSPVRTQEVLLKTEEAVLGNNHWAIPVPRRMLSSLISLWQAFQASYQCSRKISRFLAYGYRIRDLRKSWSEGTSGETTCPGCEALHSSCLNVHGKRKAAFSNHTKMGFVSVVICWIHHSRSSHTTC